MDGKTESENVPWIIDPMAGRGLDDMYEIK